MILKDKNMSIYCFPSDTFQFNGCLGEHPKVAVSINRHPGQDVRQE
jgi:hypothetical protein